MFEYSYNKENNFINYYNIFFKKIKQLSMIKIGLS